MYENVTDKFKEDSMMCAGGEDRDACQVTNKIFNIHSVRQTLVDVFMNQEYLMDSDYL